MGFLAVSVSALLEPTLVEEDLQDNGGEGSGCESG